CVRKEDDLDLW
nr:immunoglobulin heavy chain junction region [Macaca mulatta]MOW22055.1 immunoglobulin heavy chain junction region [Macaca mulatta]